MKKTIFIAILGLILGLANMSVAQVSPNYKQQFPVKKEKVESTVIYTFTSDSYQIANNYKSATLNKDVLVIANKPMALPSCCENVQVGSNADYKHLFTKKGKMICDIGYVCKDKTKGSCCN